MVSKLPVMLRSHTQRRALRRYTRALRVQARQMRARKGWAEVARRLRLVGYAGVVRQAEEQKAVRAAMVHGFLTKKAISAASGVSSIEASSDDGKTAASPPLLPPCSIGFGPTSLQGVFGRVVKTLRAANKRSKPGAGGSSPGTGAFP